MTEDRRSPTERFVLERLEDPRSGGRPISERARRTQRTLENYLKAGIRPRWMERLIEIERGTAHHRRHLQETYEQLREECGHDRARFRRRWRAIAEAWSFGDLNELIRTHNEWYPVERDLPMDLRTRDYVLINGAPTAAASSARSRLTETKSHQSAVSNWTSVRFALRRPAHLASGRRSRPSRATEGGLDRSGRTTRRGLIGDVPPPAGGRRASPVAAHRRTTTLCALGR